jgi:transposase
MANGITTKASGITIGIDLGDRTSELCALGSDGDVVGRCRFATTKEGLAKALASCGPARVILEVGTHSPWVSRWLTAQGHEAVVANARAVRSIGQSDTKNDRRDAEQLARLGRADIQLLHPIRHRSEAVQRHHALLAVRNQLVQGRTRLVVQARGLAKALGERLPRCRPEAFPRRLRSKGLATLLPGMEVIVQIVDVLNEQISRLESEIESTSRTHYPHTALLRQVSGVGTLTSFAFVLTLEDPGRFARSRSVGSYLGLRRKLRDSGAARPALGITKSGDVELRRLLIQSAHYILTLGPDSDLKRFGQRLMARGGPAPRQRAAVAVARKLAVLLHRLWVTGEVYEPLHRSSATA